MLLFFHIWKSSLILDVIKGKTHLQRICSNKNQNIAQQEADNEAIAVELSSEWDSNRSFHSLRVKGNVLTKVPTGHSSLNRKSG